jgi:uncharacterized membrane-anchored protein
MTHRKVKIGIGFAILFQLVILLGGYISAALPLWIGKEIKIETIPVDPRSIFRGDYIRLNYAISRISTDKFSNSKKWQRDEVVYVRLKRGVDGLYSFHGIASELPKKGVFLRGRITGRFFDNMFGIKYGIEAFFTPRKIAKKLEKQLSRGGIAVLMVTAKGKAALKTVLHHNKKSEKK